MNKADFYLAQLLHYITAYGYKDVDPRPKYEDGTPAHTLSVNHQIRTYNVEKGEFPITILRPIAWKSAIKEILWIYQDQSNDLEVLRNKYGVKYWDEWESKDIPGTIGNRYGHTVKKYDQMNKLLKSLVENPFGRRHIIDLWQIDELESSDGLSPCAFLTDWKVRVNDNGEYLLDMCLIQRSGDSIAASCSGVNEIQYTALLMMVAQHCGYTPGMFTHIVMNEQIYDRHIDVAKELMWRYGYNSATENKARLVLNPEKKDFYSFTIDDFEMCQYTPLQPQLHFELGI